MDAYEGVGEGRLQTLLDAMSKSDACRVRGDLVGAISALDELTGMDNGGFLFLGLGITFLLVAILPGGSGRSWAFFPGIALLIFGAFLSADVVGWMEYLWPAVLILLGGYFVLKFFRKPA